MRRKIKTVVFVGVIVYLFCSIAHALPVQYCFSGNVISDFDAINNAPYSGLFTWDADLVVEQEVGPGPDALYHGETPVFIIDVDSIGYLESSQMAEIWFNGFFRAGYSQNTTGIFSELYYDDPFCMSLWEPLDDGTIEMNDLLGKTIELFQICYDDWHELAFSVDSVSAAPVPEPATMLLLGSGLIGLAGFRRKFRKR